MSIQYFENGSFVDLDTIYASIRNEGFSNRTIALIDNFTNQIFNGNEIIFMNFMLTIFQPFIRKLRHIIVVLYKL